VARIKTKADPLLAFHRIGDTSQLLKGVAQARSLAGCGLKEEPAGDIWGTVEYGIDPLGDPLQAFVFSGSHVGAGVHDHIWYAQ
jgi:hypothetical protein